MLENIAVKTTRWIHKNSLNGEKIVYDDFENRIKVILLYLILLPTILIIGLLSGTIVEMLISLTTLIFLRLLNGGHHFPNVDQCFIVTSLAILLPSIIVHNFSDYLIYMNIISFIIIFIFAPFLKASRCNNLTKKIITLMVCLIAPFVSSVMTAQVFIESLDLIRIKKDEVDGE